MTRYLDKKLDTKTLLVRSGVEYLLPFHIVLLSSFSVTFVG